MSRDNPLSIRIRPLRAVAGERPYGFMRPMSVDIGCIVLCAYVRDVGSGAVKIEGGKRSRKGKGRRSSRWGKCGKERGLEERGQGRETDCPEGRMEQASMKKGEYGGCRMGRERWEKWRIDELEPKYCGWRQTGNSILRSYSWPFTETPASEIVYMEFYRYFYTIFRPVFGGIVMPCLKIKR